MKYIVADHIIPIASKYDVFRNQEFKSPKDTKKMFKKVLDNLHDDYGKFLLLKALLYLVSKQNLPLNLLFLKKYEKKLKKKAKHRYY